MRQPSGREFMELAGTGFRDFTRIAGGEPTVWRDILLANRDEVLHQSAAPSGGARPARTLHERRRQRAPSKPCCVRSADARNEVEAPVFHDAERRGTFVAILMFKIPFLDLPPLCGASRHACACLAPSPSPTACCCWRPWRRATSQIHDLLDADDTAVMLDCACGELGCEWERRARRCAGGAGHGRAHCPCQRADLFLGNAGTAMRPLAAALALARGAGQWQLQRSAACHACTSAPSRIWWMRFVN